MTLEPCPFCGGEAEAAYNSLHNDMTMARCLCCGATAFNRKWNRRHLTQPAQAVDVEAIAGRLREASDEAYCDYVRQLNATECRGWESKMLRRKFGRSELDAHTRAHELLGRHRALSEAAAILTAAALPNANGKEGP